MKKYGKTLVSVENNLVERSHVYSSNAVGQATLLPFDSDAYSGNKFCEHLSTVQDERGMQNITYNKVRNSAFE